MSHVNIKIEIPVGAIDGSNVIFTVANPFISGTVSVYINGFLTKKSGLSGWVETNPALGIITLTEPPFTDDEVQVFYSYLDNTSSALPEVEQIIALVGIISADNTLCGELSFDSILNACVANESTLDSVVNLDGLAVKGIIDSDTEIVGTITMEC